MPAGPSKAELARIEREDKKRKFEEERAAMKKDMAKKAMKKKNEFLEING